MALTRSVPPRREEDEAVGGRWERAVEAGEGGEGTKDIIRIGVPRFGFRREGRC